MHNNLRIIMLQVLHIYPVTYGMKMAVSALHTIQETIICYLQAVANFGMVRPSFLRQPVSLSHL